MPKEHQPTENRKNRHKAALEKANSAYQETLIQLQKAQNNPKTKPERVQSLERRPLRREQAVETAQTRLNKTIRLLQTHLEQEQAMRIRPQRFEQENAENLAPCCIRFRLDAGFGTYDNIALLIEMGYELLTKLHNHKVVQALRKLVLPETAWTRVGKNAEMVAWSGHKLDRCPYPLCEGLERFHTGDKKIKHSALAYFGDTPITENLPGWFDAYNHRQTIEAGIKETKQVFFLHRLKVRSEPAIYLLEAMTIFAANFIRWAAVWMKHQVSPDIDRLPIEKMGVKRQVQVLAHTSAKVIHNSDCMLLRSSPASSLAGKSLHFRALNQPIRPNYFHHFSRFSL